MSPPNGAAGAAEAPARILVVDDTEANRDLLARRLVRQGHRVDTASGGSAALARLAEDAFDLVLLDIMMPDMNGYEVLERLKADPELRHVPVIMITAIDDLDSVVRCIELGAEDHLLKPFNATLLRARIDSSLARKRLHDREQTYSRALERELEIGRNIQRGFLPHSLPRLAGWDVATAFHPARQVAGDFYDVFEIAGAGRLALVVADVCDKGVGAALFMAVFRSLLRVTVAESYAAGRFPVGDDAAHLVRTVRILSDYDARTHGDANMFATVFFGVLDPATGTLTYVNAGHDAPCLLAPGGGPPRRLEPTGPTVGLLPDLEFGTGTVTLAPGELLLAFTDGVTDARAPDGALYGEARLLARAAEHAGAAGAAAVLEAIEADLDAHGAGAVPFDDVTLLAVRRCA